MPRHLFATLFSLIALTTLWSCTSQAPNNALPDEEDEILFIEEADSLLCEDTDSIHFSLSRRKKLAKGYRRTFNDKNDLHLRSAREWGITPLQNLTEADSTGFWTLARVDSCRFYTVKKLTHSAPYLTPRAKWLLMTIGRNFADSLASHGVYGYQLSVTSLLRTDDSIRRLRRRNRNASENSAHRYGTTFDISYIRYNRTDSTSFMPEYRLKETLAEVLYDLRAQNRCHVKYEVRQACFHITAR